MGTPQSQSFTKGGNLVSFDGSVPHNTVIKKGSVEILGPWFGTWFSEVGAGSVKTIHRLYWLHGDAEPYGLMSSLKVVRPVITYRVLLMDYALIIRKCYLRIRV